MTKVFNRFHIFLSHHSFLYATIVGIGIVLFWRGVWHSADTLHLYINNYSSTGSVSVIDHPWWDGPLSFFVGCLILFVTRAFVSSFIGNELILSGLRIEKKIAKQTEDDVKTEVATIGDIKHTISAISRKLEELEVQVKDHHK
jgi:hypothetical protein